jgi:hypothetical protein
MAENSKPTPQTTPDQTPQAQTLPEGTLLREYGRSGTRNLRGFLESEEYNQDLLPPKSFEVYDRMTASDPTTRATMLHLTTPIRAAEWIVRPATQDEQDLEIAAFVHHCLFEWMDETWDACMQDQLDFLKYGVMVMEEVYERRDVTFNYSLPEQEGQVDIGPRDAMVWKKFGPRLPRTIWRWNLDEANDELESIEQQVWKGERFETIKIPVEKLLILVNDKIGDDWWGTSVLRGAYKPWWLLEAIQRVSAIGLERFFVGTPMARMNPNATTRQKTEVLNVLQAIRSGERSAIVYSPQDGLDCDEESHLNRAIWILQPDHAPPDSLPYIRHLEANIFTNILARFMDLGQRETGARATAEVQDDPFYLSVVAISKQVSDAWNRGPIRRLVDLNYPGVERYPELVANKISPEDIPIIARAAESYAAAGMLTPDFITEQWVRGQLGMPDKIITDEALEAARMEGAQPLNEQQIAAEELKNANQGLETPRGASGKQSNLRAPTRSANPKQTLKRPGSLKPGQRQPGAIVKSGRGVRRGQSSPRGIGSRPRTGNYGGGDGSFDPTARILSEGEPGLDPGADLHVDSGSPGDEDLITLAEDGFWEPWRELRPEEEYVLLEELDSLIDASRSVFEMQARGPLSLVIDRLVREVDAAIASGDARKVNATKAKDLRQLTEAIEGVLVNVAEKGSAHVLHEVERQKGMRLAEPPEQLTLPGLEPKAKRTLRARAEQIAAAMGAAVEAVAKRVGLDQVRRGKRAPEELAQLVLEEAQRQLRQQAQLSISEALNIGRGAQAEAMADDIEYAVYSAILDRATCTACARSDGTQTTVGSPLYRALDPPNPSCAGGARCRCIWVYKVRG